MSNTANTFKSLKAMFKNAYPNKGKATAEKEASENPQEFLRKNKNMSLKGKKGIAG